MSIFRKAIETIYFIKLIDIILCIKTEYIKLFLKLIVRGK